VLEPCEKIVKTYTCEPVFTTKQICVKTGDWHTESCFVPGPVVNRCCRMPGTWTFDPCTCTSHYCPGPVVNYCVQLPGRHICKRIWVPREEIRTVTCCHYERREHCHTVRYNVCRTVPECTTRKHTYCTCRMVPEQHTKMVTCQRCIKVPEER